MASQGNLYQSKRTVPTFSTRSEPAPSPMPQADGKSGHVAIQVGLAQVKLMKRKSKASRILGEGAAGAEPAAVPVGSSDDLDRYLIDGKKKPVSQCQAIRAVCIEPISVLLLAWPFGVASAQLGWGSTWTFSLNFVALIPLAQILGNVTEELAAGLKNDTLGGLLNATFGNAVEMILTIQTLMANQLTVVKSTLLGSILSNLLLVLGCSLFAGGFVKKQQDFSKESASANVSLLLLSATALALPACFANSEVVHAHVEAYPEEHSLSLQVSRYVSLVLLACYLAFLFFQFVTHADVFKDAEGEEEEGEEAQMKVPVALMMLAFTTALVAASSEFMVDSIEGIVNQWGIGKAFIGMILLPIVGNACEHFGAVKMAIQDKLDITIGIAVGSATQMALFVVPFAVLVGWGMNKDMDLNFGGLDTIIMCASVVLAFSILQDGSGNWLEGFMLIAAYVIVATLYWFYPEEL